VQYVSVTQGGYTFWYTSQQGSPGVASDAFGHPSHPAGRDAFTADSRGA